MANNSLHNNLVLTTRVFIILSHYVYRVGFHLTGGYLATQVKVMPYAYVLKIFDNLKKSEWVLEM